MRGQAEEERDRLSLLQRMLVDIASNCINLHADEADAAIDESLAALGKFVRADRAYIFDFDFERGIATNSHEWCAEGVPPHIDDLQALPLESIQEGLACLIKGRVHNIPDVGALPPGALRDVLEHQGIRSMVTVPLMRSNRCVGCVGFDSVRLRREYSDDEQSLLGMFARMLVNIDLRKRDDKALRLAVAQAEAASRAKSAFLANMSHEIRTPLNGVLGMLQLMHTTALDKEQREYVDMAIQASQRLTRLLTDILDISRVEAGKLALQDAPFSLSEMRDSILGIVTSIKADTPVQVSFDLDPALPDRLVGDESRLRQILLNLVGNSLKFTVRGFVRVEASLGGNNCKGGLDVVFQISDSGCGIPEDKLDQVFEPFEQATEACNRGVGLGLAIVRSLVKLMGGRIEANSLPGQGTTMRVTLPLTPAGEADERKTDESPTVETGPAAHILLVEDDPFSRKIVATFLEKSGHRVSLAQTGLQALRMLSRTPFDCILMDIHLPGMDGVEATRMIRSSPDFRETAHVPIIALTANAMAGDRERFLDCGMDDYVPKPVDVDHLRRVITETMRRGGKT